MTTTNRVAVALVQFSERNGGKKRPIFLVDGFASDDEAHAFKITSKYENKSKKIRSKYFKIQDWQAAGLRKPSWIDVNVELDVNDLPKYQVIGKLSREDLTRFIEFLGIR
jgi:hypothetical protein